MTDEANRLTAHLEERLESAGNLRRPRRSLPRSQAPGRFERFVEPKCRKRVYLPRMTRFAPAVLLLLAACSDDEGKLVSACEYATRAASPVPVTTDQAVERAGTVYIVFTVEMPSGAKKVAASTCVFDGDSLEHFELAGLGLDQKVAESTAKLAFLTMR